MTTMATTAISCIFSVQLPRYSLLPLSSKRNSSTSHGIGSSTITAGMNGKMRVRDVSVCSMRDDRVELDDNPEGIISGEWPDNFSLLSYEDLRLYLEPQIRKNKMSPSSLLGDVMSTQIRVVTVDQTVGEIDHHFEFVSGLPVIDSDGKCIGIVSKTDKQRTLHGVSPDAVRKQGLGNHVISSHHITTIKDCYGCCCFDASEKNQQDTDLE